MLREFTQLGRELGDFLIWLLHSGVEHVALYNGRRGKLKVVFDKLDKISKGFGRGFLGSGEIFHQLVDSESQLLSRTAFRLSALVMPG